MDNIITTLIDPTTEMQSAPQDQTIMVAQQRYAQVANGVVQFTVESATDPDGTSGEWIACPDHVGDGYTVDGDTWTAPQTPNDPCAWLIDIGPFYDRFGAAKMAVLTSTDAGVKAIVSDISIRKWIDLQRAEVASALEYVGTKVPLVDAALQTSILTTPVDASDNLALRRLYFA